MDFRILNFIPYENLTKMVTFRRLRAFVCNAYVYNTAATSSIVKYNIVKLPQVNGNKFDTNTVVSVRSYVYPPSIYEHIHEGGVYEKQIAMRGKKNDYITHSVCIRTPCICDVIFFLPRYFNTWHHRKSSEIYSYINNRDTGKCCCDNFIHYARTRVYFNIITTI